MRSIDICELKPGMKVIEEDSYGDNHYEVLAYPNYVKGCVWVEVRDLDTGEIYDIGGAVGIGYLLNLYIETG